MALHTQAKACLRCVAELLEKKGKGQGKDAGLGQVVRLGEKNQTEPEKTRKISPPFSVFPSEIPVLQ